MLEWILASFINRFKSQSDLCSCGKPRITNLTTVKVWGQIVQLTKSPQCKFCTEIYMSKWAIGCESCDAPICVGERVAKGLVPDSFTHYTIECCPCEDRFCGFLGEGKIELYEIF